MLKRASAVMATAVATLLVGGIVQASPPDPNNGATKPVREQNLDGNGWIQVHEQGTAKVDVQNDELDVNLTNSNLDVNVTNAELPVSVGNFPSNQDVTVTNLPDTQNVAVTSGSLAFPPVTKVRHLVILVDAGEAKLVEFATMNVTTVSVQDVDDEISFQLRSPLSTDDVFGHLDLEGDDEEFVHNFNYPLPVNGVHATCTNESERCSFFVDLAGFPA